MTPPFIPELKNEIDIRNFDKFEEEDNWLSTKKIIKVNRRVLNSLWIGRQVPRVLFQKVK